MSTVHRIVFAIGALIAIAFVGALIGSHDARSAEREPAGIVTFQCTNENAILSAAAAAERGEVETLKKLHKSSQCRVMQKPVAADFFAHDRVTHHLTTTNAGGATLMVFELDVDRGSTWLLLMVNPDFVEGV